MSASVWAEARRAFLSPRGGLRRPEGPRSRPRVLAAPVAVTAAPSKPYRSVRIAAGPSPAAVSSPCVPIGLSAVTEPTEERRTWRALTPQQTALAAEISRRAELLRAESDGELSVTESVAVAAMQLGHFPDAGDS